MKMAAMLTIVMLFLNGCLAGSGGVRTAESSKRWAAQKKIPTQTTQAGKKLNAAAELGDIEQVRQLLKSGVHPDGTCQRL